MRIPSHSVMDPASRWRPECWWNWCTVFLHSSIRYDRNWNPFSISISLLHTIRLPSIHVHSDSLNLQLSILGFWKLLRVFLKQRGHRSVSLSASFQWMPSPCWFPPNARLPSRVNKNPDIMLYPSPTKIDIQNSSKYPLRSPGTRLPTILQFKVAFPYGFLKASTTCGS